LKPRRGGNMWRMQHKKKRSWGGVEEYKKEKSGKKASGRKIFSVGGRGIPWGVFEKRRVEKRILRTLGESRGRSARAFF